MDFRLKVFFAVAKRLSFTKASEELYISQPAITKHIKELENKYKTSLFERSGNRNIRLSGAGKILFGYVEQMSALDNEMDFEMHQLNKRHSGILNLGASTTISQYVLPKYLAAFHKKYPEVSIRLITGNTEDVEKALLRKKIDIGIVEGKKHQTGLKYHPFLNDEIVLVCNSKHPLRRRGHISVEELNQYPFILRENGSGTLNVINTYLSQMSIKTNQLRIEMQLDSSESIKLYLKESSCIAFISIYAILDELKNNELQIIDVEGLKMERMFTFVENQGQSKGLAQVFKKYLSKGYVKIDSSSVR